MCRNYNIDRDRIVLRGMSMGASGTWHLGLKHPDRFVALGPYCGYVDTHHFSETPLPNFVKVGPLPSHQEKTLHMLDSIDYAANAGVVPAIACMGEKDVFFQAHVLMGKAMEKEGLKMVNLISPGTGPRHRPGDAQRADAAHRRVRRRKGWTMRQRTSASSPGRLKYSRCHWLQVLGLEEHYARAELEARSRRRWRGGGQGAEERHAVRRLASDAPGREAETARRRRRGRSCLHAKAKPRRSRRRSSAGATGNGPISAISTRTPLPGKRPGLQGPIDDAFTTPFLCVRGTGKAWNPAVQAWADASLKRFAYEWRRYFRGELPVKDDTDVTEEDVRRCNLILFGDPGSNRWIDRVCRNCRSAGPATKSQSGQAALRRGRPCAGADPAESAGRSGGPLRRPQQRPHVP